MPGRVRIDRYDDADTVHVVAADDSDRVVGNWRLLPTLKPYMLDEVFPQLLNGTPAPHHPRVGEANRFVVAQVELKQRGFGFMTGCLHARRVRRR